MGHDHGAVCVCVADHRPPVLEYERHHVWPLGLGGPDVDSNLVWICSTTHGNVHELMRLMFKAGRALTDSELSRLEDRPVSRYAANLARQGYLQATAATLL